MWKQISGFNLETARTLSNEAKDLRIKLLADVKKSTDSQAKLNADSLEALSKRKTQTKQYVTLMESQLRKLDSEIQILRGEQAKVQDALMNKQRPLDLVKKRLENRVNRPGREAVRDEVEVELEKEFQKLVVAVEALQSKNNNIENELARLEKAKAAVQADHDRKVTALQLEEQCLDLDARTEYALESRQGTPRGSSRENHGAGEAEGLLPPISPRNGTPRGGRN
jgi:predicted  nucleic acid-binding Zn-ribbon protein